MTKRPTLTEIRRLLSFDFSGQGVLPSPPLNRREKYIRIIAIQTRKALMADGWGPCSVKTAAYRRAIQQLGPKLKRREALKAIWPKLPKEMRMHPFSEPTIQRIKEELAICRIHYSEGTIRRDIRLLGIRKPR